MTDYQRNGLGQIIKEIMGDRKQTEFARAVGATQSQISKYINGAEIPSFPILIRIAREGRMSAEELWEKATGEIFEGELPMIDINPVITEIDSENLKITAYEVTGAGPEREETGYEPVGSIIIPKKLYKPNLIVFRVDGDSMEKWIMDKTYVLVDPTPQNKLYDKGIYCFKIPYSGYIIRLVHTEPDALFLEPVNRQYKTRKIAWGSFNPDWVLGRVVGNLINTYV